MEDEGLTRFNVETTSMSFMQRLSRSLLFIFSILILSQSFGTESIKLN